jgi:hypothetical protein
MGAFTDQLASFRITKVYLSFLDDINQNYRLTVEALHVAVY